MSLVQQVVLFLMGLLVFAILNGYLLAKRGQTIGKVVVKTRIVDLNGNIPKLDDLLVRRYLVIGLISCIPIIGAPVALLNAVCILGKRRRCLHDYIAGTLVINA